MRNACDKRKAAVVNVLSVREQIGMRCLEIFRGQGYQSRKVVSFWFVFFLSTDPVSH